MDASALIASAQVLNKSPSEYEMADQKVKDDL